MCPCSSTTSVALKDRDALWGQDGIWTAEEVAGLDLQQTDLVVLSACDTGLGHNSVGQGVLGLRRAFAQSGARSLVMSLWAVPGQATSSLMQTFYRDYLRKRKPPGAPTALRHAQLELLEKNRQTGEARPQDWAAFIAAGDRR